MSNGGTPTRPVAFVSYTQADRAWAEWIGWQLLRDEYEVLVQAWHSVGGTHFLDWMDRGLEAARFVVVVLSPDYLRSVYGGLEWQRAIGKDPRGLRRVLIPVLVRPCTPEGLLADITNISLVGRLEDEARTALLDGLRAAAAGKAVPHKPPPFPAARPGESSKVTTPVYPGSGRPPETDLLEVVEKACRARDPGAKITRVTPGLAPEHLEVTWEDDGLSRRWPVGVSMDGLGHTQLDSFAANVHAAYERFDPRVESELVYGGDLADDGVVRAGRRRFVRVFSLPEYSRQWDPRRYLERQARRLADDSVYPPSLYVPQRYVLLGDPVQRTHPDIFTAVVDWLDADPARLVLVLGDFGHGKTFLLHELARRLPEILPNLVPVLIRLGALEKSHNLDVLLAQHFAAAGEHDVPALRRMLERGQVALLFDGFDELALRLTYDRAAEHLKTVLSAVQGKAKVVLTSRRQHFASDDQVRTAMGDEVALVAGSRLLRLRDFDHAQIRDFLVRLFDARLTGEIDDADARRAEASSRADARLALLGDIKDLLGLSRNPRMLSFIADLDEAELRAVQTDQGKITSADLYEKLLRRWLDLEVRRRHPAAGAVPGLDVRQLRRAVTSLALRLWETTERGIDLAGLEDAAREALTEVGEGAAGRGKSRLDPAQAAFAVGSGSLLVRTDDDLFGFVHSSVMEYLVAAEAARQLTAGDERPAVLASREMSPLMADFLAGAAAAELTLAWAQAVLADAGSPAPARANALNATTRLDAYIFRAQLARQDLRDQDLTGRNLRLADLSGANLSRMRLRDVNFSGANLTGADLTDAVLDHVSLAGANLAYADLTGARLVRPVLENTIVNGSKWARAALLDMAAGTDLAALGELSGAAVVGTDPAEVNLLPVGPMSDVAFAPDGRTLAIAWGSSVVLVDPQRGRPFRVLSGHDATVRSVAFSPDGSLLASAGDDEVVQLWEAVDGTRHSRIDEAGPVQAVTFSPVESLLATAVGGIARVRTLPSGRLLSQHAHHQGLVRALAFSPHGNHLATVGGGVVYLSAPSTGRLVYQLAGHRGSLEVVTFSPRGRIAAGGDEGIVYIWKTIASHPHVLLDREDIVRSLAFTHGGGLLVVGCDSVRLLVDSGSGEYEAMIATREEGTSLTAMACSGDTYTVAEIIDQKYLALQAFPPRTTAADTRPIWEISREGGASRSSRGRVVAFSPENSGNLLVSHGSQVNRWDAATGTFSGNSWTWKNNISAIAVSRDRLAVATLDGAVWLTSLDGRRPAERIWDADADADSGRPVAFSADGRLLASSDGHTVLLYGTASVFTSTLAGHEATIRCLAFHPHKRLLATADDAGALLVWNLEAGRSRPFSSRGTVRAVSFSPDGRVLAAGGDHGIRLWDTRKWRHRLDVDSPGPVQSLAFAPDGQRIAAGVANDVILWETESGRAALRLGEHSGTVSSVAFSPDGRVIASAADDATTKLWDAPTGDVMATLFDLPEGWAVLLPDGSYELVGGPWDAWWSVKLHRFDPGELDGFDPSIRRLDPDTPLPHKAR